MSGIVFIAVIGAALLHACWNALVKSGADKTFSMGALLIGVFFLKERLNLIKLFSTFATMLGAILLRFARW